MRRGQSIRAGELMGSGQAAGSGEPSAGAGSHLVPLDGAGQRKAVAVAVAGAARHQPVCKLLEAGQEADLRGHGARGPHAGSGQAQGPGTSQPRRMPHHPGRMLPVTSPDADTNHTARACVPGPCRTSGTGTWRRGRAGRTQRRPARRPPAATGGAAPRITARQQHAGIHSTATPSCSRTVHFPGQRSPARLWRWARGCRPAHLGV